MKSFLFCLCASDAAKPFETQTFLNKIIIFKIQFNLKILRVPENLYF